MEGSHESNKTYLRYFCRLLTSDLPFTTQKIKFSIKDSFSKCDQIRSFHGDLVTFTEEILNGKLHSLCSA